jgi:hypothetical protein
MAQCQPVSNYLKTLQFAAVCLLLAGCTALDVALLDRTAAACPVTEPDLLVPPGDSAVQGDPGEGYYYANADRSILAAAWWWDAENYILRAGEEGIKTGWFRPAGADLMITGERLDGAAPPLDSSVPCCYPTRFQASGLIFPTEGCWEVNAEADGELLSFVVWVERE